MKKWVYGAFLCVFVIGSLTGCLENTIHVEASAYRMYDDKGFPQAIFMFNISNLGQYSIQAMDMEIVFFKINEYELSKKLVNSTFHVNWSSLPSDETGSVLFETFLDPERAPTEVLEIWDSVAHWQMTFKITWDDKSTHITTQTFNWYFT